MIDSHCHLDYPPLDTDVPALVAACAQLGIEALVVPGVEAEEWPRLLALPELGARVRPALGLHPIYLARHRPEHLQSLASLLTTTPVVAVGEVGLDYFVEGLDRQAQQNLFEAQVGLAMEFGLPLILHVRKAHDQVLATLRRLGFAGGGIAHAFSGSEQQARQFIDLGFRLGFGGSVTYERALKLRRLVVDLPLDSLVLETDAPDIPPAFARDVANTPLHLPRIAETIAQLRGVSLAELVAATSANTRAALRW